MRGKANRFCRSHTDRRITPAYAGKSAFFFPAGAGNGDHPRLCGEKARQMRLSPAFRGSPPPMRGKVERHYYSDSTGRITPAYAGKRACPCLHGYVPWDHPRLCGEKYTVVPHFVPPLGSPPPMRGKGPSKAGKSYALRITPAYAGKSRFRCFSSTCREDHPRLCGEKTAFHSLKPLPLGSPPPMRGKAASAAETDYRRRITPAYAGKSGRQYRGTGFRQDHPRLCGEKLPSFSACAFRSGSPPPMRGKVSVGIIVKQAVGITPAYAGKRQIQLFVCCCNKDHPRLCGEKRNDLAGFFSNQGSPPPMRGKVKPKAEYFDELGITPAYAGKSEKCRGWV